MDNNRNCYNCANYMTCTDKYKDDWKIAMMERECWTDEKDEEDD